MYCRRTSLKRNIHLLESIRMNPVLLQLYLKMALLFLENAKTSKRDLEVIAGVNVWV